MMMLFSPSSALIARHNEHSNGGMIIPLMSNEYCCHCGDPLGLEQTIVEYLGGDDSTSIDFCLACINKATANVLLKWINEVNNSNLRRELMKGGNRSAEAQAEGLA